MRTTTATVPCSVCGTEDYRNPFCLRSDVLPAEIRARSFFQSGVRSPAHGKTKEPESLTTPLLRHYFRSAEGDEHCSRERAPNSIFRARAADPSLGSENGPSFEPALNARQKLPYLNSELRAPKWVHSPSRELGPRFNPRIGDPAPLCVRAWSASACLRETTSMPRALRKT